MNLFKNILGLTLTICFLLTGCSSVVRSGDLSTATAQAGNVIRRATQMGYGAQSTLEAGIRLATSTAQARSQSLSEARQWSLVLSDTFNSDLDIWALGEGEDPALGSVSWEIDGGRYRWAAKASSGFVWWVIPEGEAVGDFYLSVDARQEINPEVGEYGLVFRRDDNEQYYLFEISELGSYAAYIYSLQGWETLIEWTIHPVILPGKFNQLEVLADGPVFDLFINGEYVGGFVDDRLPEGRAGLLVGLSEAGEESSWLFDNFTLKAPETD